MSHYIKHTTFMPIVTLRYDPIYYNYQRLQTVGNHKSDFCTETWIKLIGPSTGLSIYDSKLLITLFIDSVTNPWIGNDSVNYMLRWNNPCNIIYGGHCEGLVHNEWFLDRLTGLADPPTLTLRCDLGLNLKLTCQSLKISPLKFLSHSPLQDKLSLRLDECR